jgi:hypothetical protein
MNKLQLIGRDGPSFLPPTGGSGAPTWKCAQVLKLRKGGMSLRIITEDMNLGLQTVRTIIGRKTRIDRTSIKQLHKIDPDSRRPINRQAARRDRARTVYEEDRRQSTLERGPKTGQAFVIGGVKQ